MLNILLKSRQGNEERAKVCIDVISSIVAPLKAPIKVHYDGHNTIRYCVDVNTFADALLILDIISLRKLQDEDNELSKWKVTGFEL